MASFSIQWRSSTRRDFRRLPPDEVQRVLAEVEALAENPCPNGSEKLTGTQHTHRIRVGDYRVIYEVFTERKIIEVQRVRHRQDVYRT